MTDPFKTQWSFLVPLDLAFKKSSMCAQIVLTVFNSRHSQRKLRLPNFFVQLKEVVFVRGIYSL